MADMDGFKEASAYGFDQPQRNEAFFLKGNENRGWGVKNRLARIFNPKSGHTVMLACDHGFIMGPTSGLERVDLTINPLIEYADCLMCTRGILRSVIPPTMSKPVCLRSDGGTTILTDLNLNRVYDVEDVVRVNASAMAVMVACGDRASEQITTQNLVHTVDMGEKLGIPVLGVTAVGKDMARDARYFGLATRVCAENATKAGSCIPWPTAPIRRPSKTHVPISIGFQPTRHRSTPTSTIRNAARCSPWVGTPRSPRLRVKWFVRKAHPKFLKPCRCSLSRAGKTLWAIAGAACGRLPKNTGMPACNRLRRKSIPACATRFSMSPVAHASWPMWKPGLQSKESNVRVTIAPFAKVVLRRLLFGGFNDRRVLCIV